jgi:hypothetical protein
MTKEFPSLLFLSVTFVIDSVEIEGAVMVSLAMASCKKLPRMLHGIEAGLDES